MTAGPVAGAESLSALELEELLALVAAFAGTDVGRHAVETLAPASARAELLARRHRYEEAQRLVEEGGVLLPSFEEAFSGLVARLAGTDPPLDGRELLALARLLAASESARRRIASADPPAPALTKLSRSCSDPTALVEAAERILDRKGRVRDDASPALVEFSREIRRAREALYRGLRQVRERHADLFAEETVPLRGGRLLLLLDSGAKGRLPGLVHGSSGTGRSFYFEPLEVVETNNALAEASEEEEAERRRLLMELSSRFRGALPEIEAHLAFAAELDRLGAALAFARVAEARLPELSKDGRLVLACARHPLLDPRLAELRERVLGSAGHRAPIVALDLALEKDRRILVVTGPNAGGKTVALKTVGLLALAAQCGLPVPVDAGSEVPPFDAIVASIGDEQDLLAERSTFSGRLLRLSEAWERAGPASLVLIDELGSGTDPEEGAALATALVERLAREGGLALVTTHLSVLAARSLETPGTTCAAMEFDATTGRPTYRLHVGPPGGSEALSLARRMGLPAEWIDRAEALLSPEHRDLERLLGEVARTRDELAREIARAGAAEAASRDAAELAELAREALEAERRTAAAKLKAELAAFRERVQSELAAEVERVREAWKSGRRRGLEREAVTKLFASAPDFGATEEAAAGPLVPGARVRHRALGWTGKLERLERDRAEVFVGTKRMTAHPDDLVVIAGAEAPAAGRRATRERAPSSIETDEGAPELNLIGVRVEEGLDRLDTFLDRALRAGRAEVRIIHGHGTGRLRDAVRDAVRRHPAVASWRAGGPREGGNGATVVLLKV